MKHYGNIDLNRNALHNAVIPTDTDFPNDPIPGMLVFKNKRMYICTEVLANVPAWIPMTQEIDSVVYTQETAATAWTIPHGLNASTVFVQVFDANGNMIFPDYINTSVFNQVTIMFSVAQNGKAVVMTGSTIGAQRGVVAYTQNFFETATWVVTHGLGYYPEISVIVNGEIIQPVSIINDSEVQTTITFSSPRSGQARCI